MEFKKVTLEKVPRVFMAHKYQTSEGSWPLTVDPLLCEITFVEKGSYILVDKEGRANKYEAPCVMTHFHDAPCKIIASGEHRHYTMAFYLSEHPIGIELNEISALSVSQQNHLQKNYISILPRCVRNSAVCEKVYKNLKLIIANHPSILISDDLKSAKYIIDILAELSKYSFEQARATTSSSFISLYTTKSVKYISEHIEERIYVRDIADELKISYGYLSRIFKEDMGISIVQFINELKVKRVQELIMAKDITLEEASLCVGITDVKYLSRIFKNHAGMTVTEYKKHL